MRSSPHTRTQHLHLQPGLAVVRYTSSSDNQRPARLELELSPHVAALSEPGRRGAELTQIGQCLVLRIETRTTIVVRSLPHSGQTMPQAGLTVEYLTAVDRMADSHQQAAPAHHANVTGTDAPNLLLMGHVSRLGDLQVEEGEWLAGPDRPLPIEGLKIKFKRPVDGLSLFYFASDGPRLADTPVMVEKIFSGTRGQARPVRQFYIELRGPRRDEYMLDVEAMFLGGYVQTFRGVSLHIGAPSGREPLVGLRLRTIQSSYYAPAKNSTTGTESLSDSSSDVLIFR